MTLDSRFAVLLLFGGTALAQGNNNPFGVSPQEMLRGVDPATVQKLNRFSNALDKNPNDVNALISRAALSLEVADKGRYNFQWILFASKDLEKAIRLDPNNWMARHDYAMACFQAGDVTKAMPNEHLAVIQFTKAIALKPDSARSYMGRGWAYLMLGDEASANADFQKTLQLNPSLRPELTREADSVRGKLTQLACVDGMMKRMASYMVNRNARTQDQCIAIKGYWTNGECRISTAMAPGPLLLDKQNSATANPGLAGGNCPPPPDAVNDKYNAHANGYFVR
jgi:tetratricopeptide (TPR) repeat protein